MRLSVAIVARVGVHSEMESKGSKRQMTMKKKLGLVCDERIL